MAILAAIRGKIRNHLRVVIGFSLVIIIVAGALVYVISRTSTSAAQETTLSNQALLKGNNTQALEHAKKALAKDPSNINNILLVARLENPRDAKPYYTQALNQFKKENDPDVSGKRPIVYYDAGYMAEQAGKTSLAEQYYQEAIKAASNQSDSYDKGVAAQAQSALRSLQ